MTDFVDVLYEDNHLLVVNKPALLPTMGTPPGQPTLLTCCKEYIKEKYNKPGNVYLGIVSRLDAPVTGVVLLARTSKAAARLSKAFRTRQVDKRYLALVSGRIRPSTAELCDWVRKDERHRRMHIAIEGAAEAQEARLAYQTLTTSGGLSLLEVDLLTGRKHQIRLQLSHAGHPIVGDRKYGSERTFAHGIALHCQQVEIAHPVGGAPLKISAPLPPSWPRFAMDDA